MKFKEIRWNEEKDALLRQNSSRKNVGFAECATAIEEGRILDNIFHPVRKNQHIYMLEIDGYAFAVPYVSDGDALFLKTIFPSRIYTSQYLRKKQ
jgi:hypothetical protein